MRNHDNTTKKEEEMRSAIFESLWNFIMHTDESLTEQLNDNSNKRALSHQQKQARGD